MEAVKRLYDMAFVKRTLKCDRPYFSTGSYTSTVENLIPPNQSGMEVLKVGGLSVQNQEMSPLHKESTDIDCMMLVDIGSLEDTDEGTTTSHYCTRTTNMHF